MFPTAWNMDTFSPYSTATNTYNNIKNTFILLYTDLHLRNESGSEAHLPCRRYIRVSSSWTHVWCHSCSETLFRSRHSLNNINDANFNFFSWSKWFRNLPQGPRTHFIYFVISFNEIGERKVKTACLFPSFPQIVKKPQ